MWPEPKQRQPLLRPHFSPRQLVTAHDLNAGVAFLAERMRRHHRYLHGCGITCGMQIGLESTYTPEILTLELSVTVAAGTAIGPEGDLIVTPAVTISFEDASVSLSDTNDRDSLVVRIKEIPEGRLHVFLLVRATTSPHSDHMRPTVPDACDDSRGRTSPTRIDAGYQFTLSFLPPPACVSAVQAACGALLNRRSPEHDAAFAELMACPPADEQHGWLVVGTVELVLDRDADTITPTLHYRDRSLLPSTLALLELLRCFPEVPHIETATPVVMAPLSRWYRVLVTGYGFTPLQRIEVEDAQLSVFPIPIFERERALEFWLYVPVGTPAGKRGFRIITDFDAINSADCDVYLDLQPPPHTPYYYHYGPTVAIGGDLL